MSEQQDIRYCMRELAIAISELFPGLGFAFLLFEFHKPGVSNYISNAERGTMIKCFREAAHRLETSQDFRPDQQN